MLYLYKHLSVWEVNLLYNHFFPVLGKEEHLPIYVVGVDSTDNLVNILKPNGFPAYILAYCSDGKGELKYLNRTITFKENQWIFVPSFVPCEFIPLISPCKLTIIIFDGCDIKNLLSNLHLSKPLVICTQNNQKPIQIITKIQELFDKKIYIDGQRNSALIYSLLIELSLHNKRHVSKDENTKIDILFPIVQYINSNYTQNITLEELSEIASISPQYICKLFKEYFEVRPFEYISKVRIQYSKRLLIKTNKSINEISKEIGYNDCSYYCAVFKRYAKITPAEYRNNCRFIID